jgi:hypothetical protein
MKKYITIIAASLLAGYFLGKFSVKVEEKTVVSFQKMLPVHVSIDAPATLSVTIPEIPQFIWRTDTVTGVAVVDTAAIIADWLLQRDYGGRLIADSTGTIDYFATVQYNRLQCVSLEYVPVQRTVVTTKVIQRRWTPFLFVGGNSAGYAAAEGGVFIGNFGVSVEFGQNVFENKHYFGGRAGVKF